MRKGEASEVLISPVIIQTADALKTSTGVRITPRVPGLLRLKDVKNMK